MSLQVVRLQLAERISTCATLSQIAGIHECSIPMQITDQPNRPSKMTATNKAGHKGKNGQNDTRANCPVAHSGHALASSQLLSRARVQPQSSGDSDLRRQFDWVLLFGWFGCCVHLWWRVFYAICTLQLDMIREPQHLTLT